MPTNLVLCALVALSALLSGCSDERTADFCEAACECQDPDGLEGCVPQCTATIDAAESSNLGPPIVTDECFACVERTTCPVVPNACQTECAALAQALSQQPQPGDPLDTN